MKIMLVGDSMGIGGAETHVLALAKELCKMGNRVTVIAKRGELSERVVAECGGRARFVDLAADPRDAVAFAAYMIALSKKIKRERPDVVHAHSRSSAFAIRILRGIGALPDFKFIVSAHAKYRTNAILKLLSAWGDRCIAVSDDVKAHVVKNYRLAEEKITVISNGIDTEEFSPRAAKSTNDHTVLFASRLDADSSRGADCLCEIAKDLADKYTDIRINIAGGGTELERIRKNIGTNEGIVLLGKLPSLSDAIADASVVVGVSRVALEAMACEKNVILFGNEGALGLLDETNVEKAERTNFTCRGFGVESASFLKNEIERFFEMDERTKDQMAKSNRAFVERYHSQRDMALKTLEVYKSPSARTPRVVVGGYYGYGNLGDAALLDSFLQEIKRLVPDAQVRVLNKTKKAEKGVRYVRRYSPFSIVRAFAWADVFVLGGGSLLQNDTSIRSLLYYCSLVWLSKIFGCKCAMLSNGIGPINGRLAERLARVTIRKFDHISLRDEDSLETAESLGAREMRLGADLCFLLDLEAMESERIKQIRSRVKCGYIVVAVKGGKERNSFICSLKATCEELGLTPIFVAMDKEKDTEASVRYANEIGGIFVEDIKREELIYLLEGAAAAVSERLHLLIFSLGVGVPLVGIGEAPKIRSFLRETLGSESVSFSSLEMLTGAVLDAMRCSKKELESIWEKNRITAEKDLSEFARCLIEKN